MVETPYREEDPLVHVDCHHIFMNSVQRNIWNETTDAALDATDLILDVHKLLITAKTLNDEVLVK